MKKQPTLLSGFIHQFESYKTLGEKTFIQLKDAELNLQPGENCLSISTTIKHLNGNMHSRFTDFLTSDGEKEWRNRDEEFVQTEISREQLLDLWENSWKILLDTLHSLSIDDLEKTIYIRKQPLSVINALQRQLAHYAYHIGQIVLVGKMIKGKDFIPLSIPIGKSKEYNQKLSTESSNK